MTAGRALLDAGFASLLQQWGEPATYTHADGNAVNVDVIFDEAYEVLTPVSGLEVGSTAPMAQGWTDDFPLAKTGDLLVCRDTVFEVLRREPDGQGLTMLFLSQSTTRSYLQNEEGQFIMNEDGSMIEIVL